MEGANASVKFKSVETSTLIEANENDKKNTGSFEHFAWVFKTESGDHKNLQHTSYWTEPSWQNCLVSVRTKSGEEYEPSTLRGILKTLERHLKRHRYQYSLISSFEFAQCREALKEKQQDLNALGRGNIHKNSDCLTPEGTEQLGIPPPLW